jgi:hypothetical protein
VQVTARQAYTAAAACGAILWVTTTIVSGRREAWDAGLYWSVAYPLAIACAGALGYFAPDRPWRWGLTVMLVQAVVLTIAASSFGLLPLGLIMFAILALLPAGAAGVGAAIRRRRDKKHDSLRT